MSGHDGIADTGGQMLEARHLTPGMEILHNGAWCAVIAAHVRTGKSGTKPDGVELCTVTTTGGPLALLFPHSLIRTRDIP